MISVNGNNDFENGYFNKDNWSAPVIQMPEELVNYFKTTSIAGRTIRRIFSVGPGYNYTAEWLQNFAMAASAKAAETDPEKVFIPSIEFIPEDTVFSRLMLVDQPMIIEFDTGDSLALLFDRGSEVRIQMNSLPVDIKSSEDSDNIDANILFSEILGRKILGIQVGRRKDLPDGWLLPRGEDWKQQETLIAFILFQLEGGIGLAFEPFNESGRVFEIDNTKKIRPITYGQLKEGLTLMTLDEDTINFMKNLQ